MLSLLFFKLISELVSSIFLEKLSSVYVFTSWTPSSSGCSLETPTFNTSLSFDIKFSISLARTPIFNTNVHTFTNIKKEQKLLNFFSAFSIFSIEYLLFRWYIIFSWYSWYFWNKFFFILFSFIKLLRFIYIYFIIIFVFISILILLRNSSKTL